ncbi:MAG: ParB N-terminal domain-containing protein [Victivallaceae bacterium]|nr:ParB N-terminal domain-containing protein [Victivallaceae bacterium]
MISEKQMIQPGILQTQAPFDRIFPIQESVLKKIISQMRKSGFDDANPIIVWKKEEPVVLDGHTRLQAALTLGIDEVPIVLKEFPDTAAALDYAVGQQVGRRNITPGDMLRYIEAADHLLQRGRPKKDDTVNAEEKIAPIGANFRGKSAAKLAEILKTTQRQAERLRKISKSGSEETKRALADNEITINAAYERTRKELQEAHEQEGEPLTADECIRLTKKRRFLDLPETIGNAIEERVKREKKNYPDILYSEAEISQIVATVAEITKKHLAELAQTEEI